MSFFRPEILAMDGYVPGEQPQAGKFIKLNTNENPYPPPPGIRRAIEEVLDKGLQRYPDPMANAFRTRAAELYKLPSKDWVLCGNGSDDILTICTRAFVGQGELLRLPYPSYILYKSLAQIQGAQSQEVKFNADWSLPTEFGEATPGLKLVFLPNPNSPTGTMISREAILELADRLPCPLIVDEAYADFAEFNCADLVQQNEKIMVSRTLSKAYGLAGLRFGFLLAQPQMIEELIKVKDSYNCDAFAIGAATAAIHDEAWQADNRRKIIATRARLVASLEQLGFAVIPSQANFVWCDHQKHAARPLYEQLKAQKVLIRYMNYAGWKDGLRISVGTDEQTDVLLALLGSLCKD
ncbi:histidinol-phosphate transaminase [Anatilimnocola sp. NA78]|uniref:histidinol-phosphate transaminase n=1 Tax=Anatilimnocola sp. NA78 TaxID=3415683 RepID=UPI003CE587AF